MDRNELRATLDSEGVPHDMYSLVGSLGEDTLCLDEAHGRWFVYYSERGQRWNERELRTEDEACRYLLQLIRRDHS